MTNEKKIAVKLRDAAITQLRKPDFIVAKNVSLTIIEELIKEMPSNNLLLEIKIELKKL